MGSVMDDDDEEMFGHFMDIPETDPYFEEVVPAIRAELIQQAQKAREAQLQAVFAEQAAKEREREYLANKRRIQILRGEVRVRNGYGMKNPENPSSKKRSIIDEENDLYIVESPAVKSS
jgi:hypothetical protein